MALTDSIRTLSGIGPKKAELFAKLGISTIEDLLHLYDLMLIDDTHQHGLALVGISPLHFHKGGGMLQLGNDRLGDLVGV